MHRWGSLEYWGGGNYFAPRKRVIKKCTIKPALQPAVEGQSGEAAAEQTAAVVLKKPVGEPVETTVCNCCNCCNCNEDEKPLEKPAEMPAGSSSMHLHIHVLGTLVEKPAEKSVLKPAEKSVQKPAKTPVSTSYIGKREHHVQKAVQNPAKPPAAVPYTHKRVHFAVDVISRTKADIRNPKEAQTCKEREMPLTIGGKDDAKTPKRAEKPNSPRTNVFISDFRDCSIAHQRKAEKQKVDNASGKPNETEKCTNPSGYPSAMKGGRQIHQQGQKTGGGQHKDQNSKVQGTNEHQNNAPTTERFTHPQHRNSTPSGTTNNTPFEYLSEYQFCLMSHYIAPSRSEVVIREDVMECPGDPLPNAFFDTKVGLVRVYHGPIYGNPNRSLIPLHSVGMPNGSRPLMIGGEYPVPFVGGMGMGGEMGGMGGQMMRGGPMGGMGGMDGQMGGMGGMGGPMMNGGYYPPYARFNNQMMSGDLGAPNYGPFYGPTGGPSLWHRSPFQTQGPRGNEGMRGWSNDKQQRCQDMTCENCNSGTSGRSGGMQNEGQSGGAGEGWGPPGESNNNTRASNEFGGQDGSPSNSPKDNRNAASTGEGVLGDRQSGAKNDSPNSKAGGNGNKENSTGSGCGQSNSKHQKSNSKDSGFHYYGSYQLPGSWPTDGGDGNQDKNVNGGIPPGGAASSNQNNPPSWYWNHNPSSKQNTNHSNDPWGNANTEHQNQGNSNASQLGTQTQGQNRDQNQGQNQGQSPKSNQKQDGTENRPSGNSNSDSHFYRLLGPDAGTGPTALPDDNGSRPHHNLSNPSNNNSNQNSGPGQSNNRRNNSGNWGGAGGAKGKGKGKAKSSGGGKPGGSSGGSGNQGEAEQGDGGDVEEAGETSGDVPWGDPIKQAAWADLTVAKSVPNW